MRDTLCVFMCLCVYVHVCACTCVCVCARARVRKHTHTHTHPTHTHMLVAGPARLRNGERALERRKLTNQLPAPCNISTAPCRHHHSILLPPTSPFTPLGGHRKRDEIIIQEHLIWLMATHHHPLIQPIFRHAQRVLPPPPPAPPSFLSATRPTRIINMQGMQGILDRGACTHARVFRSPIRGRRRVLEGISSRRACRFSHGRACWAHQLFALDRYYFRHAPHDLVFHGPGS